MPHEEWIEIPLPLIVDPAVFEAARTQLEENRKRKRERMPGNIVQVLVERYLRNRRLARDFERYATTVAAFARLAMIRIMLRRLATASSGIQTSRMG